MTAYRDTSSLPFLRELERQWKTMRDEARFVEDRMKLLKKVRTMGRILNPKSVLYHKQGWNTFPLYLQGMTAVEFMKRHHVTAESECPSKADLNEACRKYDRFLTALFPKTLRIIKTFMSKHGENVTNVSIFRLAAKKHLPLHTNFDPHVYRCHMGLIVPTGDIGMKVNGKEKGWKAGKFFAFDAMQPHTVWNYTGHARYVLNVDCFRPEYDRRDLMAVHQALVKRRMSESKRTFGLSGGYSDVSISDKLKYASRHEKGEDSRMERKDGVSSLTILPPRASSPRTRR